MIKNWLKVFFFIMISIMLVSCAGKEPQRHYDTSRLSGSDTYVSGSSASSRVPQAPESYVLSPEQPEMGEYMRVQVNDFIVILDASGSKYLPYSGQVKLKIAKDIVRRLNQHTPDRRLFGGLRRYGFEAGAWSEKTALIYGMTEYYRPAFANSIEIVRWAGGKSPLALAIDKASDDFQLAEGHYLALVVVSDGNIYQGDPVEAAKRIKQRYGDRICIYTALVGDLPFGKDVLERVAKAGECGYAITSDALVPEKTMRDWADDIFHRGQKAKPREPVRPIPRPRPPRREPCADLDEALRLGRVQFDLNKWNIKPEYYAGLDRIASLLVDECPPDTTIRIQGHTCNIWTEKYNMKLSHMRATEVMKYLVKMGVRPRQLVVEGAGLSAPRASNKTEEGRVENRRAEFKRIR